MHFILFYLFYDVQDSQSVLQVYVTIPSRIGLKCHHQLLSIMQSCCFAKITHSYSSRTVLFSSTDPKLDRRRRRSSNSGGTNSV